MNKLNLDNFPFVATDNISIVPTYNIVYIPDNLNNLTAFFRELSSHFPDAGCNVILDGAIIPFRSQSELLMFLSGMLSIWIILEARHPTPL